MSEVWAVIVVAIMALVVYGVISSKVKASRQRAARQKVLPYISDAIQAGQRYHVYLSDGRKFQNVELLGTNDPNSGQFSLGGWEGMLVLMQDSGKRVFVRQVGVRCIEEV